NRVALFLLMLATVLALFPPGAAAQYASSPGASRAPRFLLAMAERSEPVPVDLKRSAVLRQPLSLAFDGVPLQQALVETSLTARATMSSPACRWGRNGCGPGCWATRPPTPPSSSRRGSRRS